MEKAYQNDEFLRKRAERQKKLKKRRLKIFFVFFIVLSLCTGVVLSLTVFFKIENITASGSKVYEADSIIKASGIKKDDNLFTVSASGTLEKLRKKLPYIESVSFERQLPDTLKIKVKDAGEYRAYFADNEYCIVSQNGWVLRKQKEKPENINAVLGADVKCRIGCEVSFKDESKRELLNMITAALGKKELVLDTIDISDTVNIKLSLENRFTVILGTTNGLEEKISHVAVMIKNIPPEQRGTINVSMWSDGKPQGTFTPEN